MIPTTLVVGGSATEREAAIASLLLAPLYHQSKVAILLEGMSNGQPLITADAQRLLARIASGCLCCGNNMIMRVHLNRLIAQQPDYLFISLARQDHLEQVSAFLSTGGYQHKLALLSPRQLHSA